MLAVDPAAANALVLDRRYPESLKAEAHSLELESFVRDESSRDASREASHSFEAVQEASHSFETVQQSAHLRSEAEFLPTQVAVAQLLQPVPFGHPRFIRSFKIVWRGAAPCSVVR